MKNLLAPACRTLLAFASALAIAPGASAQELDEVIVTAQKRAESVLDVPISMSVVQASTLAKLSIRDLEDMQSYVPNLMLTPTPANTYVFIRGIGTQGNVLSFESSVALFVDGIYGGRNRQFMDPFFDLERVEVLRGPQGALFGRNTSAGAISVTSARPTKEFDATVRGEYETEFGSWLASGHVSGSVTDNLQIRLAGKYLDQAGYIHNTLLNRDESQRKDTMARLSAAWQPADSIDVFARLEYGEAEVIGMPFEFVPGGGNPNFTKATNDEIAPERDDSDALNGMVQADFGIGGHTLTAIGGYSEFSYSNAINIQAIAPPHLIVENAEDFDQSSIELRLLSPSGGVFDYVVGLYADSATSAIDSRSTTDFPFVPGSPNGVTVRHYVEDTDSYAAFAQGTWRFAEDWRATLGARYTSVDKSGRMTRSFTGVAPGALDTPLAMDRDESFFDPSIDIRWDFADGWMTFARYAEGSKSGGFNGPVSSDTEATWMYEDESSETFELGVKGGDSRANVSVVLFETTYEDLQKSVLNIQTASFTTGNAAEARSRGVEIEGVWQSTENLRFDASVAYLDAKYTDYPGAPCPYGTPGFGQTGVSCNVKGWRLTNAPKWSGAATAAYERPMTSALKFLGSATVSYRGDVYFQPSYNPLEMQEAFTKLDLRAGIASIDDRWTAALLVRNVTDEGSSALIFETFPFFINPQLDRVHVPDRPRTFTLQFSYSFH